MINRRTVNRTGLTAVAAALAPAAAARAAGKAVTKSTRPAAVSISPVTHSPVPHSPVTPSTLADAQFALAVKLIEAVSAGGTSPSAPKLEAPQLQAPKPEAPQLGASKPASPKPSNPAPAASPGNALPASVVPASGPITGEAARSDSGSSRNIVVSPIGVAAALALLGIAAEAGAQRSFQRSLQLRASARPESDLVALLAPVRALDAGPNAPLVLANRLVLDTGLKADEKLLEELSKYKVEVKEERLADPRTIGEINAWVKKQTRGLVPSIIEDLPHDGALVALNALYFKDRWRQPFDAAKTKPGTFHSFGAGESQVSMMHQEGRFRLHGKGRFLAADFSFATPAYALTIITTTDKPAPVAELLKGAGTWLNGRGFAEEAASIVLPRLQIASAADLIEPMVRLGLPRSVLLARLGRSPQRIASISQKVTLKLDEQGAEASAATAVVVNRSLELKPKITEMVVDKPFLFALRERASGYVLIAGYMNKPEAAAA